MTDQDQIQQLTAQLAEKDEQIEELDQILELIRKRELTFIEQWRAEEIARFLKQPDYGELLEWLDHRITEQSAQLAAARDALAFIGTHTEHGDQDPCPICEAVDKALADPSPAARKASTKEGA